jgi:hypothetical protein
MPLPEIINNVHIKTIGFNRYCIINTGGIGAVLIVMSTSQWLVTLVARLILI